MKKTARLLAVLLIIALLASAFPVMAHADGSKLVAITFDDGPSSSYTPRLLDGLKARGAHCTFFVVGQMAQSSPSLVRREWQEGHEVCSHTYDHSSLTKLSDSQIRQNLSKTDAILDSAIGFDLSYGLRPPYGAYNSRVLAAANTPCFYWSVDTNDWRTSNPDTVYNYVVNHASDGDIILLHDIHKSSVTGVLRAIDTLKARGFEFVTVSEMFMRRGISLQSGKIYFDAHPKSSVGTAPAVGKPVISMKSGADGILVTITGGDSRGSIYYTTDGSIPTPKNAKRYTGTFYVTGSGTITAQTVVKWNGIRTDAVTAKVVYHPAQSPAFSMQDGKLVMTAGSNSTIYYTTDGSTPTRKSAQYTEPITPINAVYSARAYAPGYDPSAVTALTCTARGNIFKDVYPTDWYFEDVDRSAADNIFRGVDTYTFAPNLTLTRAMLITALYRVSGQPAVSGSAPFTDMPARDMWSYNAMLWAYNNGIARGYGDGTVRPDRNITRAEMSAIVSRYLESCGKDLSGLDDVLSTFKDASQVLYGMRGDVNAACALGIMRGMPGGILAPNANATRAEAATVVNRMLDVLPTLKDVAPDPAPTEDPSPSEDPAPAEDPAPSEDPALVEEPAPSADIA